MSLTIAECSQVRSWAVAYRPLPQRVRPNDADVAQFRPLRCWEDPQGPAKGTDCQQETGDCFAVFSDQTGKFQLLGISGRVQRMLGVLKQRKIGNLREKKPDTDCPITGLLNDVQDFFYVVPTPSRSSSRPGRLMISIPSPVFFRRRPQEGHSYRRP